MKVEVDVTVCCGAGMCVVTAPELFDQSDTDGAVLLRRQPGPTEAATAREARDLCPSDAIEVTTD